ncbi:hypothetical protein ANN_15518 [Periplaneta americana]|uniref:Reverse transcriptase domain-containing protein n=1 Tax=Periplaneta americana TaxID=6978 RepID=A0ABQ8SGK7_PERAM|nr:hypothetical protein ANN_15518 [Periplaneta americana]
MILRDTLLEQNHSYEQYGMKINANKKKIVVGRKLKKIMSRTQQCKLPVSSVYEYYNNLYGVANNYTLDNYQSSSVSNYSDPDNIIITPEDIAFACKGIKVDTAPGEDGVRMKVIKELRLYKSLSLIATYMLRWGHVPPCLRRARTILIYKDGNPDILKNWRPITIYSVLRRIIERVLDIKLRSYLDLNLNQRGFMSGPDLKVKFLSDIDKLIRSAVKEIINIPTDTPDAMLYAPRRLRGLGVFKAQWEAYLQHLNICQRLLHVDNPHVAATRNLPNEIEHCIKQLPITFDCSERISSQKLRKALREDSFHQWSKLKSKGLGVVFYSHWKKGNSWISTKKGHSSSQWTQAIKMNCNTIPVRTLPGRTLDSTHCRRCDEQETLPHVLDFCHHGELLRINRHNTVRSLIAASIRQNASYEVYEEVGCVSSDGSTRRADFIIIDRQKDKGVILDPAIRFEMHEQQPQEVCCEKQVIYSISLVVSILEHNTTSHIGKFLGLCSVPVA